MEDRRTDLGNQFAGLQTRWWRTHEQRNAMTFVGLRIKVEDGELANSVTQQIRGAPDSKVEDA